MLKVLIRWKWKISVITLLGMVVIGLSTYLIEPKYKSEAVLYPVNLGAFSDENYTEQMMQLLQSRDIKDSLIKIYNLSEHYKLDSAYEHFTSTMYYELGKNIKISRTEFEAVEIAVLDKDPDIASSMVNTIVDCFDNKVKMMHASKVDEAIGVSISKIRELTLLKDSITSRLSVLGLEYGIVDINSQSRELSAYLYTAKPNGNRYKEAKNTMKNIQLYGNEFTNLKIKLKKVISSLIKLKIEYKGQLVEIKKNISYYHELTAPYPSDIKYSPKRITITILGGISIFVLVLLMIGIVENKRFNFKE